MQTVTIFLLLLLYCQVIANWPPENRRCPIFPYVGCPFADERECLYDEDCAADHKCCNTPCNAGCIIPPGVNSELSFCNLRPERGPCYALATRWFYNPMFKRCQQFEYGGCGGNENNFDTQMECAWKCDKSTAVCLQPRVVGPCYADILRYWYNARTGRCERFFYGGCMGNDNNFETIRQCYRRCRGFLR